MVDTLKTFGDTLVQVDAKAVVYTPADRVTEGEVETLDETVAKVVPKALMSHWLTGWRMWRRKP